MHYFVSFLVCNHLDEEERTGWFALIVFCLVTVNVPQGAVDWSAVCDRGIFSSYSLTFCKDHISNATYEG